MQHFRHNAEANATVRLCLDPPRFNQELIWPMYREPTIQAKKGHYMIIIDTSSWYHNLKSPYLATFACCCSSYRFTRLCFPVAPANDMFQMKINPIFKGLPNLFCIIDDILFVECDADGRDHNRTLRQVLQIMPSRKHKIK